MEEVVVLLVMMTNPDVAKRVRNWKGRAAVYISRASQPDEARRPPRAPTSANPVENGLR